MPEPSTAPRLRIALGSFGEAGHTFPVLALARELRARGHEVMVHTWHRWQPDIEAEGLVFAKAPQYALDPETGTYLEPYEAVRRAVLDSEDDFRRFAPDVVVSDVLTNTPALIAERLGIPSVTLIPHVHPVSEPRMTPYSTGMQAPRTPVGRNFWQRMHRLTDAGYRQGEREYDELRRELGLPSAPGPMPTLSRELTLVATLPQLEQERVWPDWIRVTGPLLWEPASETTAVPEGEEPLVLVAPSTSKDPDQLMLRAAMRGLADEPVRVLGTTNRRRVVKPLLVGRRSRLVEWCSYAQVMPESEIVICNGGHGTVVRALASGCAVLVVPDDGDQRENALRVYLSGAGLRLPRRWATARSLRMAVRRLLDDPQYLRRAREIAAWCEANPGHARAADLIEEVAARHAGEERRPVPAAEPQAEVAPETAPLFG
ncbi:MAG: glycosyltransferase [Solirubrobacteraceae bacterium]|nr:glycosyltransferase [Solirubrobacteraceae bacterium]